MAAYRRVRDSRRLQADCKEPVSAPEPYARQSSMSYLYLFSHNIVHRRVPLCMGEAKNFDCLLCSILSSGGSTGGGGDRAIAPLPP